MADKTTTAQEMPTMLRVLEDGCGDRADAEADGSWNKFIIDCARTCCKLSLRHGMEDLGGVNEGKTHWFRRRVDFTGPC